MKWKPTKNVNLIPVDCRILFKPISDKTELLPFSKILGSSIGDKITVQGIDKQKIYCTIIGFGSTSKIQPGRIVFFEPDNEAGYYSCLDVLSDHEKILLVRRGNNVKQKEKSKSKERK